MLTFLTLAALAVGLVVVLALFSFVAHLIGFVIALPFKIVGFALKLVGFVLMIALACIAALVGGGALLFPLLPFALVVLGVVWLFKRRRPAAS